MTTVFGSSVNIFDPLFGATTSDAQTAPQMAMIALGTEPGSIDSFPDFGFVLDEQVNRAIDPTAAALLPLEVQQGLLAEPAFVDASVTITGTTNEGDGGVSIALAIQITAASGDAVGFAMASG